MLPQNDNNNIIQQNQQYNYLDKRSLIMGSVFIGIGICLVFPVILFNLPFIYVSLLSFFSAISCIGGFLGIIVDIIKKRTQHKKNEVLAIANPLRNFIDSNRQDFIGLNNQERQAGQSIIDDLTNAVNSANNCNILQRIQQLDRIKQQFQQQINGFIQDKTQAYQQQGLNKQNEVLAIINPLREFINPNWQNFMGLIEAEQQEGQDIIYDLINGVNVIINNPQNSIPQKIQQLDRIKQQFQQQINGFIQDKTQAYQQRRLQQNLSNENFCKIISSFAINLGNKLLEHRNILDLRNVNIICDLTKYIRGYAESHDEFYLNKIISCIRSIGLASNIISNEELVSLISKDFSYYPSRVDLTVDNVADGNCGQYSIENIAIPKLLKKAREVCYQRYPNKELSQITENELLGILESLPRNENEFLNTIYNDIKDGWYKFDMEMFNNMLVDINRIYANNIAIIDDISYAGNKNKFCEQANITGALNYKIINPNIMAKGNYQEVVNFEQGNKFLNKTLREVLLFERRSEKFKIFKKLLEKLLNGDAGRNNQVLEKAFKEALREDKTERKNGVLRVLGINDEVLLKDALIRNGVSENDILLVLTDVFRETVEKLAENRTQYNGYYYEYRRNGGIADNGNNVRYFVCGEGVTTNESLAVINEANVTVNYNGHANFTEAPKAIFCKWLHNIIKKADSIKTLTGELFECNDLVPFVYLMRSMLFNRKTGNNQPSNGLEFIKNFRAHSVGLELSEIVKYLGPGRLQQIDKRIFDIPERDRNVMIRFMTHNNNDVPELAIANNIVPYEIRTDDIVSEVVNNKIPFNIEFQQGTNIGHWVAHLLPRDCLQFKNIAKKIDPNFLNYPEPLAKLITSLRSHFSEVSYELLQQNPNVNLTMNRYREFFGCCSEITNMFLNNNQYDTWRLRRCMQLIEEDQELSALQPSIGIISDAAEMCDFLEENQNYVVNNRGLN